MTNRTPEEQQISQRYRELPREEPPHALDEAILAASRRAAETRPAPLVVPSGRRRWYFPLAAAAIIVLAVAVTVHVQREQPDSEALSGSVAVVPAPERQMMRVPSEAEKPKPAAPPALAREAGPAQGFTPDPRPRLPSVPVEARKAPEVPPAAAEARQSARADAERAAALGTAPSATGVMAPKPASALRDEVALQRAPLAKLTAHSPEQWLQGIADLRRQGRHDEADRSLAEFRQRYPNYKISEAMLEKVEKR